MHAAHQSGAAVAEAGVAFGRYQTCHNQFVVQFHPDETRSAQNQQPTEGPIPNHRLGSLFLGFCFLFCFVLFCFGRADVDVKEENGRYRTEKSTCPRHPSSSETPSAVRVVWRPIVGARPLCRTGSSIVSSFLFSFLQYFFSKYFLLDCLVAISSLVRRLLAAFFFLVAVARK